MPALTVGNAASINIAHVLEIWHICVVQTALGGNKVGTIGKVTDHRENLGLILALGCELQRIARSGIWVPHCELGTF